MISKINYFSQGNGVPLVFQHGLTANLNQVTGLLGGMEGIHLLSVDCPGHGLSPLPVGYQPCFDKYADEVIALLNKLNIEKAMFGGISMGSGISLNIAIRHPERVKALVLVRPAWLDQPNPENLQILLPAARLISKIDGKDQFKQLKEFKDISLTSVAESLLGVFAEEQQPELAKVIRHMVGDRPFNDFEQLKKINVPCLVLGNESDPLHPYDMAEKIFESIEGSVLRKLTSKTHFSLY